MNRIKSILIDDEPRGLSSLQKLLEFNCPEVEVMQACRRTSEAKTAIEKLNPELIFLDIEMPGKNGFELLDELAQIDFEIIFVTAHNDYTTQALHLSAVDYLLKPVNEVLLIEAVKRAGKRIGSKTGSLPIETFLHNMQQSGTSQKMKLCIPFSRGFEVVDIQKINYIEASGNYSNIHFIDRPLICASKSIYEYETLLEDSNFVRVHKSFVVNLDHIAQYIKGEGGNVIMNGGKEIEVSRRKKEVLMRRMKEYYKY
ncbi:MAG TPA: LytTR family DNA-binding domain-containing protein [Saprospiraceae bacterium]|nr:LytTR family DNA-binding domain-containing protein [Saprospiraceae bacterium]